MSFNYKEQFSVAGKKCIVTGGAQGLSRGMAEGLLENGAEVVLMDLQAEKLQKVVEEYGHGAAGRTAGCYDTCSRDTAPV